MFTIPFFVAGVIAPLMAFALPGTPPRQEFPEFVPAPGMPSLASLNITTEMLHAWPESFGSARLKAREDCRLGSLQPANVDDVIVCFNFLQALGNYVVTVSQSDWDAGTPGVRRVAYYNSAFVVAVKLSGGSQSATASAMASAVQWVFTNCNSGGQVAGEAPTGGNTNINVVSSGEA